MRQTVAKRLRKWCQDRKLYRRLKRLYNKGLVQIVVNKANRIYSVEVKEAK